MQGQINTNLGNISIDSDVIAAICGFCSARMYRVLSEWHPLICVMDLMKLSKEGQYYQRHRSFY